MRTSSSEVYVRRCFLFVWRDGEGTVLVELPGLFIYYYFFVCVNWLNLMPVSIVAQIRTNIAPCFKCVKTMVAGGR